MISAICSEKTIKYSEISLATMPGVREHRNLNEEYIYTQQRRWPYRLVLAILQKKTMALKMILAIVPKKTMILKTISAIHQVKPIRLDTISTSLVEEDYGLEADFHDFA